MPSNNPLQQVGAPEESTGSLLSLTEVRLRYGIRDYWIYTWVAQGRLHAVNVGVRGKKMKYPDWELEALAKDLDITSLYTTGWAV